MDDLMLPPLPEPAISSEESYEMDLEGFEYYTADQMREYAKKAVEAERLRMKPVHNFLRGAEPLEGVWYGERHPTERGAFWWRKHLPLD